MTHLFKKIEPLTFHGYDSNGKKTVVFKPLENGALQIGDTIKSIEQWDDYFKKNLSHEDLNCRTLVLENGGAREFLRISNF